MRKKVKKSGINFLNKPKRGISIFEVLMGFVIMSIIVLMVTRFFSRSQALTLHAMSTQETTRNREILKSWILPDLKSASRHSIGSQLINGGFELAVNSVALNQPHPAFWREGTLGGGSFSYEYEKDDTMVKNGYAGLAIKTNNIAMGSWMVQDPGMEFYIPMVQGVTYLVSAWAKSSDGTSRAVLRVTDSFDNLLNVTTSSSTSETDWTKIGFSFTYPPPGGPVLNDRVMVRIGADSDTEWVYFDDISFTPLRSTLIDETGSPVTINNTIPPNQPHLLVDPLYTVGIPFIRVVDLDEDENDGTYDAQFYLFRYRIQGSGKQTTLLRERYDIDNKLWEDVTPFPRIDGLSSFSLTYGDGVNPPENGKDSFFTLELNVLSKFDRNQKVSGVKGNEDPKVVSILPLTP